MEDKTELLYNSLFESGDYTKSFEEFQAQFSTEENVGLLYSSLNKSGLYTKTPQEFSEQFFPNIGLKKKDEPMESTLEDGSLDSSEEAPEPLLQSIQQGLVTDDAGPFERASTQAPLTDARGQQWDGVPFDAEAQKIKEDKRKVEDAALAERDAMEEKAKDLELIFTTSQRRKAREKNEDAMAQAMRAREMRDSQRWNEDGTHSTVKFMSYEQDGVHKVAPTLFPRSTVQRSSPRAEDWLELGMDEAIAEAERRNEVFTFDSQEEAEAFAKGSWKTVNTLDLEAQKYYNEYGRDYLSDRQVYDKYLKAKETRMFLEEELAIQKNTLFGDEGQYDDLTPKEQEAYGIYFREDGSLRGDAQEIIDTLDEEEAKLWKTIDSENYMEVQDNFDTYLEKKHRASAQQAANVNYEAKAIEKGLNNLVLNEFGVTLDQLNTYQPANEAQEIRLNEIVEIQNSLERKKELAAFQYETALTYFDAKANKDIGVEFVDNLEGFSVAFMDGYRSGQAGNVILNSAMGLYGEEAEDMNRAAEEMTDYLNGVDGRQSRAMSRFNSAEEGFSREVRSALRRDPAEVILTWAGASLAQILPYGMKLIPSFVATGAAAGGGVGSIVPGIGTAAGLISGGMYGLRAGYATTNLVLEYTNGILDAGRELGYNMNNAEEAGEALQDDKVWERGRERGLKRGIPIALMDFLMTGLAGKVFKPVAVASKAKKVGAFAAEAVALDAPFEATGELLAQLNVGDEISVKEIIAEAGGSIGMATPFAAMNIYKSTRGNYNQRIAENLMNMKLMASERASDTQIQSWSNRMLKLGKISAEQNQRILENLGLRKEAQEILDITGPSRLGINKKVQTRLMELLDIRAGLDATTNSRSIFSEELAAVNKEIAEIGRTNELSESPVESINFDFGKIGKRTTVPSYRIGNTMYSKTEFLNYIENISLRKATKLLKDSEVVNDEETSILLEEKLQPFAPEEAIQTTEDAIQESSTTEVDVQEQATDGEGVGEGDVITETTEEITPEDEVTETEDVEEETIEVVDKGTKEDVKAFREGTLEAKRKKALLAGIAQRINDKKKLTKFQEEVSKDNDFEIAELQGQLIEQEKLMSEARDLEESLGTDTSVKKSTPTKIEGNISINKKGKFTFTPEGKAQRNKVVVAARKAAKAIKKILPKTRILLHESNEEFLKAVGRAGRAEYLPTENVIHVNLSSATESTMAHEVFHAVFLNSVKTDARAAKAAEKMMLSVRKSLKKNSALAKKIDAFAAKYTGDQAQFQNEERLAELIGILASSKDYKQLSKPAKNAIIEFFKDLALRFGIELGTDFGKTDESVIDLMNTIARKTREGREIEEADVESLNEILPKDLTPEEYIKKQTEGRQQKVISDVLDVNELEVVSKGGSSRIVYMHPDGKNVIKVAKTPKGLEQNIALGFGDVNYLGSFVPELEEQGLDYIIIENVPRNDTEVNKFLKPLKEFTPQDFKNKTAELQDAMRELELEGFMDYNILWNDFTATRNWGMRENGEFVLVDEGALDDSIHFSSEVKDWSKEEWGEVLSRRRENKKKPAPRQQIIGENAELSAQVREDLQYAKIEHEAYMMQKEGVLDAPTENMMNPAAIKEVTGWELGADGKWKYEIQDGRLKEVKNGTYKLGDIYNAPEFYEAYPEAKDISVAIEVRPQGRENSWFMPEDNSIEINVKDQRRVIQDLVHELQHFVQFKEGFAIGGNANTFYQNPEIIEKLEKEAGKEGLIIKNEMLRALSFTIEEAIDEHEGVALDKIMTKEFLEKNMGFYLDPFDNLVERELIDKNADFAQALEDFYFELPEMDRRKLKIAQREGGFDEALYASSEISVPVKEALYKLSNHAMYERLMGEVEARNVTKRLFSSAERRARQTLESTEDVSREDQIAYFDTSESKEDVTTEESKPAPRQQMDERSAAVVRKGRLYGMNMDSGYFPRTASVEQIRKAFGPMGFGVRRAKDGGFGRGGGVYLTLNGRKFTPPSYRGRRQQQEEVMPPSPEDSMVEVITRGRAEGYSEASIREVLKSRGHSVKDIKRVMAATVDSFSDVRVPFEFGNIVGGMPAGIRLFQQIQSEVDSFKAPTVKRTGVRMTPFVRAQRLADLREANPTLSEISDTALLRRFPRRGVQAETVVTEKTPAEVREKALQILRDNPVYQEQSEQVQMELVIAMDRALGITANRSVAKEIAAIRNSITQRNRKGRELQAIKRELRNLIRTHIPTSKDYSQAAINRLVRATAAVTEDNYRVQVEKVLQVIEKQRENMRAKVLKKLLTDVTRGARKTITDTKKNRVGSLDIQGQSFAEVFKKALTLAMASEKQQEKAMEEFRLLAEELETDEGIVALAKSASGETLTSKEERLVNIAVALDLVKNLPSMSLEEVQNLANDYAVAASMSRQELSATRKRRALETDALRQKVTDALRISNPELFHEDGTLIKDLNERRALLDAVREYWVEGKGKGLSARLKGQVKAAKAYWEIFDWKDGPQMVKSMFDSLKHLGTFMNSLNDTLYEEVFNRLNRMDNNSLKGYFTQQDFLRSLGYEAVLEQLFDTEMYKVEGIKSTVSGKKRNESFSKDQLLRLYALSLNPVQNRKLEAMGFTRVKMIKIEEYLGKDVTGFADKVVAYLSNEYYEGVNDVYRDVNDVNLNYVENYFPTMTTQADVNPKQLFDGDFNGIFNAESAPALRNRNDMTSDINLKGASFTSALESHVKTMEHYKAYAADTKKLNAIFNTNSVDGVLTVLGMKKMVKQSVNNAVNPDSGKNALNSSGKIFNALQTKFTSYALAFRLVQIGKQMTSFINAFENYTFRKSGKQNVLVDIIPFLMDYAAVMAQPRKYIKMATEMSPTFRYRLAQGVKGDLAGLESGSPTLTALENRQTRWAKFAKGFKKGGAAPTIVGDIMGVMGYMANYRRNIKNGMSEEKAVEAFNEYNQTQQTRRPSERAILQQNSNFIVRGFTMFGSTPILYINNVMQASTNILRSWNKGGIKSINQKDVRRLALNLGAANAAFVAMSNLGLLLRGDDEERKEAMRQIRNAMLGLNLVYMTPFVGSTVKGIENYMTGNRRPADMGVNPFVSLFNKWKKAAKDDKEMEAMLQTVIEIGIGAQLAPFIALIETAGNLDEAGIEEIYDMIGYSESYREKAAKEGYEKPTRAYQRELDAKAKKKARQEANPAYIRDKKKAAEQREKERNKYRYNK